MRFLKYVALGLIGFVTAGAAAFIPVALAAQNAIR